jgi:hypothetical protein
MWNSQLKAKFTNVTVSRRLGFILVYRFRKGGGLEGRYCQDGEEKSVSW